MLITDLSDYSDVRISQWRSFCNVRLRGYGETPSELGILSSCLGKRQSRAVIFELCAKAHCELLILN